MTQRTSENHVNNASRATAAIAVYIRPIVYRGGGFTYRHALSRCAPEWRHVTSESRQSHARVTSRTDNGVSHVMSRLGRAAPSVTLAAAAGSTAPGGPADDGRRRRRRRRRRAAERGRGGERGGCGPVWLVETGTPARSTASRRSGPC